MGAGRARARPVLAFGGSISGAAPGGARTTRLQTTLSVIGRYFLKNGFPPA